MRHVIFIVLLCLVLSASAAFAFNLEKAQSDYQGADFNIAAIQETLYESAPAIAVSFTIPLDKKLLRVDHVTLTGGEFDHWILSDDRTKIIFPFVAPETEYQVQVSNLITDILGQSLRYPQSTTVETGELVASVSFATSAHILSSSSPKYLPVTTLNVDEVTIRFFKIPHDKVPGLIPQLRNNGSDGIYLLKKLNESGELVHTGRFPLKTRKNQRTEFNIDLRKIKALKPAGAYVAVMSQPGHFEYELQHAFFMQTDIGVHIRKYEKSFDVYTQDITSGKPLADILVEISDKDGKTINSGKTDKLGRISFLSKPEQHHLFASKNNQISLLPLNRYALDLSALKNSQIIHSQYQIYPWGPRNLYRPGETIAVNILVRDFDGKMPAAMPLKTSLMNPDGSSIADAVLQPTQNGFYRFEYKTHDFSQTGQYRLQLNFAEDNEAQYTFMVEEFMPERLDLQLFQGQTTTRHPITSPVTIEVPIKSQYLYGAPASGNKADGFAIATVDDHPFENLPTFFFGDKREMNERQRPEFPEITLDSDGAGLLDMENVWADKASPIKVLVTASVYESGGRPITRSALLTMFNTDHLIGIEPQFEDKPNSDTTVDFKVGYADTEGTWQANKDLQLKLIHMERNWYWHNSNANGWHWAWNDNPITVFAKSITTNAGQTTTVSLPVNWGTYVLEVTDGDTKTSYEFSTSWSWWNNTISDSSRKPDQVSLGFDKTTYKPGETAKLRINPPQDGLALVTVESSQEVLFTSYVEVKSEGTMVDIVTSPSWRRHDLYASVMVIRPGDMKSTPVPTRSFGMVHLPLNRPNTKLEVTIDAPESVESSKAVTAKVNIAAESGPLPQGTHVVVALVDVGILNITRYETPDAEEHFFSPRRYNIDLFDNYGEVIDNIGPKAVRQRFGGDYMSSSEELSRGGEKPKSDREMVSFFSDPIRVDKNGNATVTFNLPAFNGKLRWMVMAFAHEQFGSTDTDTKVADRVVTQIAMPRFMAQGDHSTIALDMRNMSGSRQDFTLEINQSGAFEKRDETQFITLDHLDKTTLTFPIVAESSKGQGVVSIHLTGNSTDPDAVVDIKRTWRLGMRAPYNSITRKTTQTIQANQKWLPKLKIDDLVPESIQVQMTLSNRPPIDLASHFQYLLRYPYGCLEQSVSTGYPWLLGSSTMLNKLGVANKDDKRIDEKFRLIQVQDAVRLVLNRLKYNGSFGSWSTDSPEDKWLTVYAAEFLNDARAQGAGISNANLMKINKRLNKYLSGATGNTGNRYSDDNDHYNFAVRSYAGYVLAKNSSVRLSDLRRLSNKFEGKTDDDGLSWMYLAAAFKMAGDAKNAENSYTHAMEQWQRPERLYYGEYGSTVRDLTRIIELSIVHEFDGNNDLFTSLSSAVKDRRWLSTQERISLFRLAAILDAGTETTWNANLLTKNGKQSIKQTTPFNSVFSGEMLEGLNAVQAGSTKVYANISLVGQPKSAPKPVSNEMTITRNFYNVDGQKMLPTIMKSGEMAVVELIITATERTPDGLVVDLLPAGLEMENQNLALASVNLADIVIDGKPIGKLAGKSKIQHEEFRDDRYVAAISLNKNTPVRLFYLVRAVTPGTYVVPGSYVEDMYRPYRHAIGSTYKTLTVTY